MKTIWHICLLLFLLNACTEHYEADIENPEKVLVIDAFAGNFSGSSYVRLSYSLPFDTIASAQKVSSAKITLEDNTKIKTTFSESSPGEYRPTNPSFRGESNKTYTLTVETADKEVYVSYPQKMLPQVNPSKISGGYAKNVTLFENSLGQTKKEVEDVCEVYYDFKKEGEEIPRLRFTSTQIVEYIISRGMLQPVVFYCWLVIDDNSLRFTNEKYATRADEINNQTVSVTTPDVMIWVKDMNEKTLNYVDSVIYMSEYRRIIRITHYRLNPASYAWYKGIESQSSSEGKIFDPLTAQLYGNFFCKSDPEKPVMGFFEVSPITHTTWLITRVGPGKPVTFKNVQSIFPASSGFSINKPPYFWIN